jgi:hypothetical protein
MPVTARGEIVPEAEIDVGYKPDGGLTGAAGFDLSMNFGIKAALFPFAQFSVLWGLWEPTWTPATPIKEFDILPKKELFRHHVDLGGDMTTKTAPPPVPEANKAPPAGESDPRFKQKDIGEKHDEPKVDKTQVGPTKEVSESGNDEQFNLQDLLAKLKQSVPGVAKLEKFVNIAMKVWKVVEPYWSIFKLFTKFIGDRIDDFMEFFTTELPSTGGDVMSWLWKLAKRLFGLVFGNIVDLARSIEKLIAKGPEIAVALITKAVDEGQIGVKRSYYYIWQPWPADNIEFLAAAEWKCHIPGFIDLGYHPAPPHLLRPSAAAGFVLYEVLKVSPVPYTNTSKSELGEPYNDFWRK